MDAWVDAWRGTAQPCLHGSSLWVVSWHESQHAVSRPNILSSALVAGGKLLEGTFDEQANKAEFQKAVDDWRSARAAEAGKAKTS